MRTQTTVAAVLLSASIVRCDCGADPGLGVLEPNLRAEPSSVSFGSVYIGFTARKKLVLENIGGVELDLESVRMAEGSHAAFSVDDLETSLSPGASREVVVSFTPTAIAAANGTIVVSSNDPDEPTLEIPIEGLGDRRPGPALSVCVESVDLSLAKTCAAPHRLDFGALAFGATKEARVSIESVGTLPLVIASARTQIGSHGSFSFEPTDVQGEISVSETRVVTVRFSPAVPEERNATLEIRSNDGDVPVELVLITGSGVAPALCPSASLVDFGIVNVGGFADRTLTLESCGDDDLDLRSLEILAQPEFVIRNLPALPRTMPKGDAIELALRYAPTNGGIDRARLAIGSDLVDGFIELVGTAASCDLSVLPSSVNFNAVPIRGSRTRSVVATNIGAMDCTISDVALGASTSDEFEVVAPPTAAVTVSPGADTTIEVTYTPDNPGTDSGTLELRSSDPDEPNLSIPLNGRRAALGECALELRPDPIQFGVVALGATQTIQVTVENIGESSCAIFASLGANTARDFRMAPVSVLALLPGRTETFDVEFSPRTTDIQTGELEVSTGLVHLPPPEYVVPLSGSGSGARLCPDPNPLVFGTHAMSSRTTKPLRLTSCGTETLRIDGITLAAPTSSEYSLAATPQLPTSLAAGASVGIEVAYRGADTGRDDGIVRVTSSDAIEPVQEVELIAASSDGPCGDVLGRICDLGGEGPAAGVHVYVDGMSGRVETTTNANGDYVLTCVSPGTWTVHAELGSWSTSFTVGVVANQTTSVSGEHCLDPDSAKVAVVWGEWDSMQNILDRLRVPYTFYEEPDPNIVGESPAGALVNHWSELSKYDIVFLNCGWEEELGLDSPGRDNLRRFVEEGGSLYTSDWGYDVIEVLWPSYVDYHGDDANRDSAEHSGNFDGMVDVVHAPLRSALSGVARVPITSCCAAIDGVGGGTTTYLQGDRLGDRQTRPFMVSFEPTPSSGRVFYTDFHNSEQPDIDAIFRWLVMQL